MGRAQRSGAVVRPYQPADREALLSLADQLVAGVPNWRDPHLVLAAVRRWVVEALDAVDDEAPVWVATVGSEVAGFVAAGVHTHWSGERDGYIGELVVADRFRRRGVAGQLMAVAQNWARSRGCRRVTVQTGAANTSALDLYRSLGYAEEEVSLSRPLSD